MDRESVALDDASRKQFGGTYARGALGVTHYELLGDSTEPVVVMLHGATTGIWDFDLQVDALRNAGFRVLRYDALGRGLSDRPDIAYTKTVYVSQLEQLLEKLEISTPVFLLGHSLGGATAVEFASGSPAKVQALALISPVINAVNASMPYWVCNTPIVGDFLLRVGMIDVLHRRANEQWQDAPVDMSLYDRLFERQASIQGFEHASCSMFQTDLVGDYREAYKAVGNNRIPGLMIYGGMDNVIVRDDVEALKSDLPSFRFHLYPEGGHCTHISYRDSVNRELVKFFKSHLP
ncbi:MAG: alpha/beta hydrolase [Deltaproteobacteria bacterium]|nr:alpha/beta hydrolase [Deltaproteobacteria bacterium]